MEDSEQQQQQQQDVYILHFFPFSLYSLMARFAFELAASLDPDNAPRYEVKLVNMSEEEHISEEYLTTVSAKGKLPSLTAATPGLLPHPITDSRDISDLVVQRQRKLLPFAHKRTIYELMDLLYAFHAKALTVPEEERNYGVPNLAAARLERRDISERYRRALEMKSVYHDSYHSRTLEPEQIAKTEQAALDFLARVGEVLESRAEGQGPWLFGNKPTIIDAHAVPMIVRLLDINREEFVPESVRAYALGVKGTEEWTKVTHGRATMWRPEYGPVAELSPL